MPSTTRQALPASVSWLGHGGLVPFAALALAAWTGGPWADLAQEALLTYGAVILSFVGALHWGLAMALPGLTQRQRTGAFAWSVVPALVAWPALLVPMQAGAVLLAVGFLAHLLQDRRLAAAAPLPAWYLPLRLRLTVIASLCVLVGAWA